MTAPRRRKVVATLLKLGRKARPSGPVPTGPGCGCDSCVRAWDRHHVKATARSREPLRMRLGLY